MYPYINKNLKTNDLNKNQVWFLFCHLKSAFVLVFLTLLVWIVCPNFSHAQTTVATGAWNNTATWSGGVVPTAGQSVTVNHAVTLNYNSPTYNNVTVNAPLGSITIIALAGATLNYSGNITVSGILTNNGGILLTSTSGNHVFTLSGTGQYIHNPLNNTALDETIFSRSTSEVFSNTSTLTIQKWFDLGIPLGDPTRVGLPATFGHVTLSVPDTISWEQDGLFMDAGASPRVNGNLTVTAGTVSMDNGTAGYNLLILNSVFINGTGRVIFCSGTNRAFTMTTGTFQDISTAVKPTILMDNCFGPTVWQANGSVTIGHNFYGIVGPGMSLSASLSMNVIGDLTINGGNVNLISGAVASLTLTVSSITTISGSPGMVRFIDGNSGNMTFTTNYLTISGGGQNTLMGGNFLLPHATGIPIVTINQDLTISGATNTHIIDAPNSTQKLRLNIGRDLIINGNNANFTAAKHKGALTVNVVRNISHTLGRFIGELDTNNVAIDSVIVGGTFTMNNANIADYFRVNYGQGNTFFRCVGAFTITNSATGNGMGFCGIYNGAGAMNFNALANFTLTNGKFTGIFNSKANVNTGNFTFNCGVNWAQNAGYFRGIDNRYNDTPGNLAFTTGNLNYAGGNFMGYYAVNNNAATASYTVNGLLQITFNTAATDTFSFIGYTTVNSILSTIKLSVTVAGNFNITGANGAFISSVAKGKETINLTGNMNISGGKNSFNSYPASNLPNQHPVLINIGGDLAINGGTSYFSAHNDTMTANITGNYSMTLGEFSMQAGNLPAMMNINGGFTMSGGTFYMHKNATELSYSTIDLTVNADNNLTGDFSHTGGIINFDNNVSSTQVSLTINSPNITYGGTGSMTMANAGTNSILGIIFYGRTGTAAFNRTSTTHSIQQIEQHIETGTTLNVVTGNVQVASLNVTPFYNSMIVNSGATLDLQGNQMYSNNLQAYAGFRVSGRLRLTRTQGFYDGTTAAAINSVGNMTFLLLTNSVIEYYGTDNQVITGIGVGMALAVPQKYYNLEINFTGTPNTEFVYPTNIPNGRSVVVRNKLILTAGELNLDNDHDPTSGGRAIIIERDSTTAITRTSGYIRSEVYDSSACVIWKIGTRVGAHAIPFGYNATSYIPMILNVVSGNVDTFFVSTYHTPAPDNLPFPPGVPNVNNLVGANNSLQTADRFWFIRNTGPGSVVDISFLATAAELAGITNPRAQDWIPLPIPGWSYPIQGTQSTIGNGTLMQGATTYVKNWWTLAGLATPLPITLVDFAGSCDKEKAVLRWTTATETDNAFFRVTRSPDGIAYETSGFVTGHGSTNNLSNYSFTDPSPISELTYYQLVQTDYDGKETFYGPVVIQPCLQSDVLDVTLISSDPSKLDVIIKAPEAGTYVVSLINMNGQPLVTRSVQLEQGMNLVSLPTADLSAAIYMVRVHNNSSVVSKKTNLGFNK